jgi:type IV fimbrial biogenesis protein FimT
MRIRFKNSGFTMVELMIVVVIFAVLATVGIPQLQQYLASTRMLSAAQSANAGLQFARAEAVRRNAPVTFVLTNDADPTLASATPDAAGRSWQVRTPNPAAPGAFIVLESKNNKEGASEKVTVNGAATVTFTGLGSTTLTAATNFDFGHQDYTCAAVGTTDAFRCKRVRVSVGGQTQLCDPAVPASATTDSRRCL